jgi:hypothetical protein
MFLDYLFKAFHLRNGKYLFALLSVMTGWLRPTQLSAASCPTVVRAAYSASKTSSVIPQRLNALVVDGEAGAKWTTVTDCNHPEWPAHFVLLPVGSAVADPVRQIGVAYRQRAFIWAGERIKLWSADDLLRIEVDGIAEETKEEGQRIRVRLLQHFGSYGQSPERQLMGIVRGDGDVELVR